MRTSLKLSSFAIAAIVIMTAASSSFAQAQANDTLREAPVTAGATEILAVNSARPVAGDRIMAEAPEVKSASEMRNTKKSSLLSPSMFNVASSSQFVKADANKVLGQEFKTSFAPVSDSQFTENSRKSIEFVPSRGQKLPDNKITN